MAGNGNDKSKANLRPPMKKGETLNPNGSSAKARARSRERKKVDAIFKDLVGSGVTKRIDEQGDPYLSLLCWLERVTKLTLAEYKQLIKAGKEDRIPMDVLNILTAIQSDMNDGKTTTLDNVFRRLYGDIQKTVDVTTDGQPINTPRTLTTKEAAAMFAALEAEFKATDREDEEEAEQPKETPSEATETPIS